MKNYLSEFLLFIVISLGCLLVATGYELVGGILSISGGVFAIIQRNKLKETVNAIDMRLFLLPNWDALKQTNLSVVLFGVGLLILGAAAILGL